MFRALRPNGVVLLDVPHFLWILKNYRAPEPMRMPIPDAAPPGRAAGQSARLAPQRSLDG